MSILMIHAQRARKKTSLFSEKIYTIMIDNVMKISCMNLQHIHIRTRQIILHRNISRVFFLLASMDVISSAFLQFESDFAAK